MSKHVDPNRLTNGLEIVFEIHTIFGSGVYFAGLSTREIGGRTMFFANAAGGVFPEVGPFEGAEECKRAMREAILDTLEEERETQRTTVCFDD